MKYIATLTNGGTVELELSANSGEWSQPRWGAAAEPGRWLAEDEGAAMVNLDHVMSIVPADRAQPPSEAPEVHRDADGSEWIRQGDGEYCLHGGGPSWALADIIEQFGTWDESKQSGAKHPWRA